MKNVYVGLLTVRLASNVAILKQGLFEVRANAINISDKSQREAALGLLPRSGGVSHEHIYRINFVLGGNPEEVLEMLKPLQSNRKVLRFASVEASDDPVAKLAPSDPQYEPRP